PPLVPDDLHRQSATRMLGECTADREIENEEDEQDERRAPDEATNETPVATLLFVRRDDDRLEILARCAPARERRPERGDDHRNRPSDGESSANARSSRAPRSAGR